MAMAKPASLTLLLLSLQACGTRGGGAAGDGGSSQPDLRVAADLGSFERGSPDAQGEGDAAILSAPVLIFGDSNRDGNLDAKDIPGRGTFDAKQGAFFLANLDDDDSDGTVDAEDDVVNGAADEKDLAPLQVQLAGEALGAGNVLHLRTRCQETPCPWAALFEQTAGGWKAVDAPLAPAPVLKLAVEGRRFASAAWDGLLTVEATVKTAAGQVVATDEAKLRVAPWLMLPASARTLELYVATGYYANQAFLADLKQAAAAAGVTLAPPYATSKWHEMWMQDTMELGYTQLPGHAPLHVVLRANRGVDSYPESLLGPDLGFFTEGQQRSLTGGDTWADWLGNLEVTPPLPGHPLGRIYYGLNVSSGIGLDPKLVAFLRAQGAQDPFWVDTSWLTIKHVDEIFTFVPGPGGTPHAIIVSPAEAAKLVPGYGPYNQGLQAKLDAIVSGGSYPEKGDPIYFQGMTKAGGQVTHPGIKALLGLTDAQIVRLPLFYTSGHSDWSNPVNSLYLDKLFVVGDTYLPAAVRTAYDQRFAALGLAIHYVDDAVYHQNLGNVHCATNTRKQVVVPDFWNKL